MTNGDSDSEARPMTNGHSDERRKALSRTAVPSFFTLMNLLSGYLAVVQTIEGRFEYACWLIVLAGLFDALDGMMARLTDSTSLFGVELDSLSDIVSFGVAPSVLIYVFGLQEYGAVGLIVSALPTICGAVRLARFNVRFDGIKRDYFMGLPTPAMAMVIVAFILNFDEAGWFHRFSPGGLSVFIPLAIGLSILMISTVKFDALPRPTRAYILGHPRKTALYGTGFLLIIFLQQIGLLVVLTGYLLINVFRAVYSLFHGIPAEKDPGST